MLMANKLDQQYLNLLHAINEHGVVKKDRTGTGTKSIFGYTIRHNMKDGFPLLTTKKMAWKSIVTELLWFLRGDTNIKYLVDNNCHIWDGDAYQNYAKLLTRDFQGPHYNQKQFIDLIKSNAAFAKEFGELGPIYGKQWRSWVRKTTRDEKIVEPGVYETRIDQIQSLINDLKTNPDSRRLMVSAWNVGELDQMVLPPCHYGFQVWTRELTWEEQVQWVMKNTDVEWENFYIVEEIAKPTTPKRALSLMWNQRSVDTFLGLPFNIASYGLLLEIISKAVNMVPDQLIGNLGDTHLYLNHEEAVEEQLGKYYSPEERADLLKTAMGEEQYNQAVSELMPFGGGMSEYYSYYEIPTRTREPFDLPKLVIQKTNAFWKEFDISQIGHLDSTDFVIENYQSHPTIKAPLSN
jgi:thymidylate synthase